MMVSFQRACTMPMRRALPSCSSGLGPLREVDAMLPCLVGSSVLGPSDWDCWYGCPAASWLSGHGFALRAAWSRQGSRECDDG